MQRDLPINLFSPGTAITITLMSFFSCYKLVNSSNLLWVAFFAIRGISFWPAAGCYRKLKTAYKVCGIQNIKLLGAEPGANKIYSLFFLKVSDEQFCLVPHPLKKISANLFPTKCKPAWLTANEAGLFLFAVFSTALKWARPFEFYKLLMMAKSSLLSYPPFRKTVQSQRLEKWDKRWGTSR